MREEEKNIKSVLEKYLDYVFEGCSLGKQNYSDGTMWFGVGKEIGGEFRVLVGCPYSDFGDGDSHWFYDGDSFRNVREMFNVSYADFDRILLEYLNRKYEVGIASVC